MYVLIVPIVRNTSVKYNIIMEENRRHSLSKNRKLILRIRARYILYITLRGAYYNYVFNNIYTRRV